jgi:GNAT superfamily N-acetyltransferase/SAM-dependent methyltransferase
MKSSGLDVRREDLRSPVAVAMIAALDAELVQRYPEEAETHVRLEREEVEEGRGAFVVAYLDGEPVGCGAIRRIDTDTGELKRMYVVPQARGRGIGRHVLARLENEGHRLGVKRILLVTGQRQPEALALYASAGFVPVPPFGEYAGWPLIVSLAKDLLPTLASGATYDRIGRTYALTRRPDPRIAAAIMRGLGDAEVVVNVGAGAGAYEPADRAVVAVEPSWQMIQQRGATAAPAVQASAEALPFPDGTFDAALAVLTLHHWTDWRRGLEEMRRVANRLVLFTVEPADVGDFWFTAAYLPEIVRLDQGRCPSVAEVVDHLGNCTVEHIAIPHDCRDGFLAAFWRRPEAYLDPQIRAGISAFALLDQETVARGIGRLEADLESGEWEQRFGSVRGLDTLDVCYRLVVAG